MASSSTNSAVDELAEAARADGGAANLARLWQAVYGLEHWWLFPTGDAADPRPMVGVVEDRTFLLAFTSDRHLRDFATRRDPSATEAGVAALSVSPADVTRLAPTLARQGVAGILFDQGVHGFVAPVNGLESMWTQFGAGGRPGDPRDPETSNGD
jgi:hypothetical protein